MAANERIKAEPLSLQKHVRIDFALHAQLLKKEVVHLAARHEIHKLEAQGSVQRGASSN